MTIGHVLSRLASQPDFPELIAAATAGDAHFPRDLALVLTARNQLGEALEICESFTDNLPDDLPTILWALHTLIEENRVESAIRLILAARRHGIGSQDISAVVHSLFFKAAETYNRYVAVGDLARATGICDLLIELSPDTTLFRKARVDTLAMQQRQHQRLAEESRSDHYRELCKLAIECQSRRDFAMEQQCRVEIARHPIDEHHHSITRVTNIAYALSRILSVDVEVFDVNRIALARELLTTLAAVPTIPVDPVDASAELAAGWEHTMRFLLGTIDLDAIFDKPAETSPAWPMGFTDALGNELSIAEIAARSEEMRTKVLFVTSASAEYFERHAKTYLSSILASCDCECLVFICLSSTKSRLADLAQTVGIHDRRVIYGCDDRDPRARPWRIHQLAGGTPFAYPGIYYATCGLMHMDVLLQTLGCPIFVTGIDTVLQRGVTDMLAGFGAADIVLNKMGAHVLLGGQMVNNLVLVYPTANAFLFLQFMKSYHGRHVSQLDQPEFLDQLDLHMAKLHLMTHGRQPNICYFGPLDINNAMFNRDNYQKHFEYMRSYRFLNMFVGGCRDNALLPEDVEIAAIEPTSELMSLLSPA